MSSDGGIRVLHVDDEPDFTDVAAMHLERVAEDITVATEPSARDGLSRLRRSAFDCVISDHDMQAMDGLEFLKAVREEFGKLPFILFTGKGSEEIASEAISAGVTEYLQKDIGSDQYTVLANRIRHAVGEQRAKSALRESERQFSTLVSNLPGLVYRARNEPEFPLQFLNDDGELAGYDIDAIESGTVRLRSLIDDEDERQRVETQIRERIDDEEPFEVSYEVEMASGDTRWIVERGRVVGTEDGVELLEGCITELRDPERRRWELERYETIIEAVGDPVYALDRDGVFTFVNEAFEPMTGYGSAELIGQHIGVIMTDDDVGRGDELIQDLLSDPDTDSGTLEMDVVTKSGERIPSENNLAILPSQERTFTGTAGVIRDIHERKEREQRLSEFASVVSHDLRNPLNVVQGRIELVQQTGELAHLDAAADATERMEQLISDLLTLARQGESVGTLTTIDLSTAATQAWDNVGTVGATLEIDGTETLEADPERFRELFENLFRNSIEHGRPEAYEEIVSEPDRRPPDDTLHQLTVTVGTGASDSEDGHGFYVADDGKGIPTEEREDVFARGYTTTTGGTGFGLAIVEDIAAAHGWSVEVTESEGGGARFEFRTTRDDR